MEVPSAFVSGLGPNSQEISSGCNIDQKVIIVTVSLEWLGWKIHHQIRAGALPFIRVAGMLTVRGGFSPGMAALAPACVDILLEASPRIIRFPVPKETEVRCKNSRRLMFGLCATLYLPIVR